MYTLKTGVKWTPLLTPMGNPLIYSTLLLTINLLMKYWLLMVCKKKGFDEDVHWTSWWRHQMETFFALLAICAGNSPATGEFLRQRPVTRGFDVFFDLRLNKRWGKQWRGWWFQTPSRPIWCHCNVFRMWCRDVFYDVIEPYIWMRLSRWCPSKWFILYLDGPMCLMIHIPCK